MSDSGRQRIYPCRRCNEPPRDTSFRLSWSISPLCALPLYDKRILKMFVRARRTADFRKNLQMRGSGAGLCSDGITCENAFSLFLFSPVGRLRCLNRCPVSFNPRCGFWSRCLLPCFNPRSLHGEETRPPDYKGGLTFQSPPLHRE